MHLRDTYSAAKGSRKAELLRTIWRTDLAEGEDPSPHLGKLKSAYSAIVTAGSKMDDEELAFAILMSLPSSYDPLVQSYYLSPQKDSASIINSVQTEWRRRDTAEVRETVLLAKTSLLAKTAQRRQGQGQQRGSYDENAWCNHHQRTGHHTNHCFNPQAAVANRIRPVASNMANVIGL